MPNLSTTGGLQLLFSADAVNSVYEDAPAGVLGTYVTGLLPNPVDITGGTAAFLTAIGAAGHFAQFTLPTGNPVWVRAKAVKVIRACLPALGDPPGATLISMGTAMQSVQDPIAQVQAAINAAGGSL